MRFLPGLFLCYAGLAFAAPSAVDQFGPMEAFPDRTSELQDLLNRKQPLPEGIHRITAPLELMLTDLGAVTIRSAGGGATLIMDGPGPAIRIKGTHEGTASPKSFKPKTWHQRMPVIEAIEVVGNHPEAVGLELEGCVAPVVSKFSARWCLHGIHLVVRNRNVVVSDCHLYENSGIGLYLDDVNLHQINVSNSHISYNRKGGIVVRDGNVRNLQITGCDIEANMPGEIEKTTTANILLDVSGSKTDKRKSIAEVAITGCTIQHSANYGSKTGTIAEGGANVRLLGKDIWPIDSVTITGNVISDTTTSIDIDRSMDVTISGNTFFAPKPANLKVTNSRRILVNGNTFNPRQFERPGTITFEKSKDCIVSNCIINDFKTKDGALILNQCEGFQIRGNIFTGCQSGIEIKNSRDSNIHDNIFRRPDGEVKNLSIDKLSRGINVR